MFAKEKKKKFSFLQKGTIENNLDYHCFVEIQSINPN